MAEKKDTRTVDEVIQDLPKNEQLIVKRLRAIILECLPKAEEKISYGVPFYRNNKLICFIWPASIVWGPKDKWAKKGVSLGFNQGNLMSNDEGLLLAEGRKQVYCMYFNTLNEIHEDQIKPLLYEAGLIDDSFKKKKGR